MIKLAFVLLACGPLQSPQELDAVTLTDGRVMLGHIEEELAEIVVFREIRLGGRITALHRLPLERIASIRRSTSASGHPVADVSAPDVRAPDVVIPIPDKAEYLNEIIEEYRVHNLKAAALRLAQLTAQLTADDRPALEQLTREALDWSLARFGAEVQLAYSLQRAESGYFRLYYMTRDSLRELATILMEARDAATVENVCCDKDAATGTCARLDWIAQWIDRPKEYDGRGLCAAAFSRQITKVMGMNRELTRIHRFLGGAPDKVRDLQSDIARLRKLHQAVYGRMAK